MTQKKILFIEPFYKGSHRYFLDNLESRSQHKITTLTKNGVFWKWKFLESSIANTLGPDHEFNIIMGSNMLDLATWAGINRQNIGRAKLVLYFHENQLTYPENKTQNSNNAFFGYKNLTSCFAADHVIFNSDFHRKSFMKAGKKLSKKLPSSISNNYFEKLKLDSSVVPVGIDTTRFETYKESHTNEVPVLLWNHRWEFDKNPELFLKTLIDLKKEEVEFKLIMLGSAPKKLMPIFDEAKEVLSENIIQWGRVSSFEEYAKFLWMADILPVTSNHDFFGVSVLEALTCHTRLLLPKRCAYPDHFPVETYPNWYYEDDGGFKSKLRELIQNESSRALNIEDIKVAGNYSWEHVITKFDNKIDQL